MEILTRPVLILTLFSLSTMNPTPPPTQFRPNGSEVETPVSDKTALYIDFQREYIATNRELQEPGEKTIRNIVHIWPINHCRVAFHLLPPAARRGITRHVFEQPSEECVDGQPPQDKLGPGRLEVAHRLEAFQDGTARALKFVLRRYYHGDVLAVEASDCLQWTWLGVRLDISNPRSADVLLESECMRAPAFYSKLRLCVSGHEKVRLSALANYVHILVRNDVWLNLAKRTLTISDPDRSEPHKRIQLNHPSTRH